MVELADVFNRFAPDYLRKHGAAMLPSHHRAINDIIQCRTEALGCHLYRCDTCDTPVYAFHSCRNRSCPKCHFEQTKKWLEKRQEEVLPIPYFHITITVPEELRFIFRSNQTDTYGIFMKACAEAILELARDPKWLGATPGVLSALHTWNQQMLQHIHTHNLVTGGGVADDGSWRPAPKKGFLFPEQALSKLVRGKVMSMLKRERPDLVLPQTVWQKKWVVHCTPWAEGVQTVLDYLARYAFRIAINNSRIVAMDEKSVTFRYKDRKQKKWRTCQISGEEFMRRFLQHVLPGGFHKIRYYGLWHPSKRSLVQRIWLQLEKESPPDLPTATPVDQGPPPQKVGNGAPCPCCSAGKLFLVQIIQKPRARAP